MESLTIKLPEAMVKKIDAAVNGSYGTKSEFVREAIRDKLEEDRKNRLLRFAKEFHGISKTNTSDKELERIKKEASKEFFKRKKA
jgi:Arc/MetJ-type ribon-helix-helix transcriptional regulator